MEEGLKEEEENQHQEEDEGVGEDGTQIDEAEDIGLENLATLMTSEGRPTLIIVMKTGAEMGALPRSEVMKSRTTPREAINNRGNTEVPLEVTLRTGSTRWASVRNI